MTTCQNLLCYLLDPTEKPLPPSSVFEEQVDMSDLPLAAICLAQAGAYGRFEALLPTIDQDGIALVSRYCLFLGLAREVKGAMLLFDALHRRHRGNACVWLDLAILQAAWGFDVQALRSLALRNALTGGPPVGRLPAFPPAPISPGGSVHILTGDESRFHAA